MNAEERIKLLSNISDIIDKIKEEDKLHDNLFEKVDKKEMLEFISSRLEIIQLNITQEELTKRIEKVMIIEGMSHIMDDCTKEQKDHFCKSIKWDTHERHDLEQLVISMMKELGEIAECIKNNRYDHWKNELGDLCGLCVLPMLELANTNFDDACKLGKKRKEDKILIKQKKVEK